MTRKITVTIFALAVLAVGLLGPVQRTEVRAVTAAISGNSNVIVVAGEFPWQRGH